MIKIIDLKHRWEKDGDWLLDIPYLELSPKESLALVGISGCGKSTLLALLAAWIVPTQGEIWFNDVAIHSLSSKQRAAWRLKNLAWQGKHHHFFEALSVPKNLAIYYGLASELDLSKRLLSAQKNYPLLIKRLALNTQQLAQGLPDLSLGELQRLQVIRTCLHNAPLTLLDEPSSHLDQSNRKNLTLTLFSEDIRGHQDYLIIATHDLNLAQYCDQIVYLDHTTQDSSMVTQSTDQAQCLSKSADQQGHEAQKDVHLINEWDAQISLPVISQTGFAWLQFTLQKKLYATLMIAAVLAILLPYFVSQQIQTFQLDLNKRAQHTPLVISALNSEYDLFFSTIYFKDTPQNELKISQAEMLFAQGVKASPIVVAPQVKNSPLLGTDRSYYHFRQFEFVQGRAPHKLGEVCLSQDQAQAMKLKLGMSVHTSPSDVFQLNAPYPIDLRIVGIFKTKHPSDQGAYFTTLESAWAARGYAHSHRKVSGSLNDSLVIDQQLNLGEFHLHDDPDHLPVSMLITHGLSDREKSLTKARLRNKYRHLSILDPQVFLRRTLDFTGEVRTLLKPLFNFASGLSLALILLMLSLHYQSQHKLRLQLLMLGLKPHQVLKLSLLEYMFFIVFCLLILVLGLVLIRTPQWASHTWIQAIL
ncbi:MAG: hypothetical protein CMH49_01895 [Myxococcales bacterium]|nr:hypothetical protein [Myxococcales bacterium]